MESTTLPTNGTILNNSYPETYERDLAGIVRNKISIVTYSLVFVLGTTGNGLVIFTTAFQMKKTVNTVWFLNLAIADFTFSFFLLFNLVYIGLGSHWPFGHVMCKLQGAIVFSSLIASIYLLVVISVDRCIAVRCPVWARNHRTPRLASSVVWGIWILALVLSSPSLYFRSTRYNSNTNETLCVIITGGMFHYAVIIIRFVFGFTIPFCVIVVCYGAIVVRLRRDHLSQSSRPFRVITAVIVAFFVCWFPYYVFYFLFGKAFYEPRMPVVVSIGLYLSLSLAYFNSCLNPILYFCMGHSFKEMPRCSLLSALANAFTEDRNHCTTDTKPRSVAELESRSLCI